MNARAPTLNKDADELPYGTWLTAIVMVMRSSAIEQGVARYISESLNNSGAIMLALSLCIGMGWIILRRIPQRLPRAISAAWPMFLFCGFALTSSLWSPVPEATAQETIHVVMTVVAAMFLAALASWRQLIKGTALGLVAVSFLSLLTVPFGGIDHGVHAGALQGFWEEKNGAGQVYAYAGIASVCLAALERRPVWLWLLPPMAILTLLAESTTSLLCLVVGISILAAIVVAGNSNPGRAIVVLWAAIMGLGLGYLIWTNFEDQIFELLGKDRTLTGRAEVWDAVLRRIHERPWLGYGYHAFWNEHSPYALRVRHEVHFDVFNAHSSLLEALLSTGIVGTSLLIWFAVRSVLGAGGGILVPHDNRRFGLPLILAVMVISFSESILIGAAGIGWFAYLAFGIKAAMGPAIAVPEDRMPARRFVPYTDAVYL